MDFTEYSLEELKKLDYDKIKHMSKPELYVLVKDIQSHARKQKISTVKELKKYNLPEPMIYRAFSEKDTVASQTKRLDFRLYKSKVRSKYGRHYLISLFFDAQRFLNAKTSTIEGWKKTQEQFERTIKQHTGEEIDWGDIKNNKERFTNFFKLYNELRTKETEWKLLDSSQAFKDIADYMSIHKRMSYKSLYKNLKNKASKYYDKQQEREQEVRVERKIKDAFDIDGWR